MDRRIVLLGKTGSGKSSTANTILRGKYFKHEFSPASVTKTCEAKTINHISVVDTPGMCDTKLSKDELKHEIEECVKMSVPGPHVFLLVIRLGRFTEEEQNAVKWIQENFGEDAKLYTIVLFTHADQLGKKTIEEFLKESPELEELINTCGGRYCAFKNNDQQSNQVQNLMQKIDDVVKMNGGKHYTNEMYEEAQRKLRGFNWKAVGVSVVAGAGLGAAAVADVAVAGAAGAGLAAAAAAGAVVTGAAVTGAAVAFLAAVTIVHLTGAGISGAFAAAKKMARSQRARSVMERRILLLGKTRSGKSSTANTLRGEYFKHECSAASVTKKCEAETIKRISVFDTPGMCDTNLSEDELKHEIKECVKMLVPGPHVFLLVIRLGRFTDEKNAVKWIQENFGEDASRYTIVLFTYADQLGKKTIEQYLQESPKLRELINSCGGRYCAFNNDQQPNQVQNLMQKIDDVVEMNGGTYYNNEMYEEAQRKLRGFDWKTAGVAGAGLSGAGLSGAGLSGAGLSGAGLSGAGLSGAGLSGAGLSGAGLSGAGLSGAGLSGAVLVAVGTVIVVMAVKLVEGLW